jgi:hypothetical protein
MNIIELQRALRQLRLGGIATVLETRLHQAQAEPMAPIDLISCLVADELTRRSERLLDRRRKQAAFRDPHKTLDNFDFTFNPKMNRSLVFDLATCAFIDKREDALKTGENYWATWRRSPPCSIAYFTMDMCSSAVRVAGAPRRRQPPWETLNDSLLELACSGLRPEPRGGFAPATPLKSKTKPSSEGKTKSIIRSILRPPVGRDRA